MTYFIYLNKILLKILAGIFIVYSIIFSKVYSNEIIGKPTIIDGDTIKILNYKIRLHGIDSPEINQLCLDKNNKQWQCGIRAKNSLNNFISNKNIKCIYNKKDRYKRFIGTCYLNEIDIQEWMVKNGWAIAYKKYSKKYVEAEIYAKNNNLGIWKGKFLEPYKWRRLNK